MIPLLPIALQLAQFIPAIAKLLAGDKAEEVAQTVVDVAEAITGTTGDKVIDALKADPTLIARFQTEMMQHQMEWFKTEIQAQRDVIIAEASSESWLTANWRPLVMVVFTGLVVGKWMGWTAAGIGEALELQLLEIIKLGLSGYVVGRSAEKVAPYLSTMFGKKGS